MEEAQAVLDRLRRIEALEGLGSPADVLLGELRALVAEAEAWARREGVEEPDALARCREALAAEGRDAIAR
jgi:hypothetical protein